MNKTLIREREKVLEVIGSGNKHETSIVRGLGALALWII
jgi:hypothetical protein